MLELVGILMIAAVVGLIELAVWMGSLWIAHLFIKSPKGMRWFGGVSAYVVLAVFSEIFDDGSLYGLGLSIICIVIALLFGWLFSLDKRTPGERRRDALLWYLVFRK